LKYNRTLVEDRNAQPSEKVKIAKKKYHRSDEDGH